MIEPDFTFPFLAGRPSLDFTNTVRQRRGERLERLRTPEDLCAWMAQAGLVTAPVSATPRQLEEGRGLREAVHRVVVAAAEGQRPEPDDVAELNRWGARPMPVPQMVAETLELTWIAGEPVDAALATLARDAIALATGDQRKRIRECEGPDCTVIFVDVSRAGRRRWCSMDRCGNQLKTAAYRRRIQEGAATPTR